MPEPSIGSSASAELIVSLTDLASALPLTAEDAFPAVFATARMVALMEIASARLLHGSLEHGQLSVGVGIETSHTAPTPLGATVTATSKFLGPEGKVYLFEVAAYDAGGEIGRGTHKRAIVDAERLRGAAARRLSKDSV